jgi:signal transduction histidine kinase
MRLLQVSLRSLLLYSILLVLISIPVSLFSIRTLLNEEADESLALQSDQFLSHIKSFEYLDDLETDIEVLDHLSYNIHIKPAEKSVSDRVYMTTTLYDSISHERKPLRQLSSGVLIKGKPYVLTVQMSLVENNDLVRAIGLAQVILFILLAAGLLFLNRSLSKRLWKPFYKTLDQLKAYELDKSESVALEKSNIVEFDDLNKTVSHLTERNRKVFLQQKEFIENASHELQTPIAIFQTKLDKLMQNPHLSGEEAETISELESTAMRMARLNKNLLLLSKIDNEQFMDTETFDLSILIIDQLSVLKPMAELGGITIVTSISPALVKANRALIEILLTNLFHNAIRHSPENKVITVSLKNGNLSISNKGNALKMSVEKMMERFSKGSSNPNSTGLGLSIIKKICDSCGYQLEYNYSSDVHTFAVLFKNNL